MFSVNLNDDESVKIEVKQSTDATEEAVKQGVKHIIYQALNEYPDQVMCPYMTSKEIGKSGSAPV